MNLIHGRSYWYDAFNIEHKQEEESKIICICRVNTFGNTFNSLMLKSAECTMAAAHALRDHLPHVGFTAVLLISTLKSYEGASRSQSDPPPCDLWSEWDVLNGRSVLDSASRWTPPVHFFKRSFVLIAPYRLLFGALRLSLRALKPVACIVLMC